MPIAMSHPYDTQDVVQIFMENVYRLHGMPLVIVFDRDKIFTSDLFQNVFKSMGTTLRFSTSYHPQFDGQTERVNQCVEAYLRCMVFQEPRDWHKWLPTAEWWYNTSYHTSLQVTPYEALYGVHPPQNGEQAIPGNVTEEIRITAQQREELMLRLKDNLLRAQNRIKKFADRLRSERSFQEGDMVYLKMQPYRQNAFGLRGSLKLCAKFYGPFRILKRIGKVAYHLQLPEEAGIHPVFHVSQLKKHVGNLVVPLPNLPLVDEDGNIKTEPVAVLARRVVPRRNEPVTQWLVHWENLSPEDATWEDSAFIQATFPHFRP